MFDYKLVDDKLNEALSHFDDLLPQDRLESVRVMVNVGEEALALETFCSNLYEFDISVPARAYELIDEAGRMMRMDESKWRMLQSQVPVAA
jgi:hypothetical protein